MKNRVSLLSRVVRKTFLSSSWFLLEIQTTEICPAPGQFFMLFPENYSGSAILPRPISVYNTTDKSITFLIQVAGNTTRYFSKMLPGELIRITGPLGNYFPRFENPWLVAGGVGLPPVDFYKRRYSGTLFAGFSSVNELKHSDILQNIDYISTMDSSSDFKGTVVDLVEMKLIETTTPPCGIIACGPHGMLHSLHRLLLKHHIPLHVSLEGQMACGTGVCHGCAFKTTLGKYKNICSNGPVFPSNEVWK
ncbi:MAG: hypothetical protein JXR95_10130 [Deltaproteobacteria bacterium]|nr:hypothetical protein [Deltaproteobacteria bacterium]